MAKGPRNRGHHDIPLHEGDTVMVGKLKRLGTIASISATSGSAIVVVGSLRMRCPIADLSPTKAPAPSRSTEAPVTIARSSPFRSRHRATASRLRIDLHGYRTHDAVQKASEALDSALLDGVDCIEIVHGIGEGKVMNAVHAFLRKFKAVRHFALDPLNPGLTKVYL